MAPDDLPEARFFQGAQRVPALPAFDRGQAYGDALFETLRAHRGELPWWDAHWARLSGGAGRLGLALPDPRRVRSEAADLLAGADGVLKLILSRGAGGRGYAPPAQAEPVWTLSRHPLPPPARAGGLRLRWCALRLGEQPALAGLKHCNRLEQVLARAEWDDPDIDEGLLRNAAGEPVCATAANLFVLHAQQWTTPPVDRCGVAGICRQRLIELSGARVAALTADELQRADAIFLCNAVRGILPVARLGERQWAPHPAVAGLRRRLGDAHPAFVPGDD
ncbi:aminodeoxychorismate lyase [Lysobacter enzymogenes]|uniref:Aminodeoxychorismate lyase n=1 Tax=Lysobacter enzymogenes TaxID=69 RepID=A0AAU9AYA7_LYSEN|nr:aminodeoxychorismate lyase [Lysobacter enzymogenes]BAV98757.1 4-amino-4-deoxychorismate lyase [Lysobacter enzymogenes]